MDQENILDCNHQEKEDQENWEFPESSWERAEITRIIMNTII